MNTLAIPLSPGSLTCGNIFTCGLHKTGQAFCWGNSNAYGQLGTNSTTGTVAPAPIAGNHMYIKISAGYVTACGIRSDLSGWCWGLNDKGQAGAINKTQPIDASLFAPTPIFGNDSWLEIAVGRSAACGIKIDKSLWCWGSTYTAALGNGILESTALIPQQVVKIINGTNSTDVIAADSIQWDTVAVGFDFACAITTLGSLFCWGDNGYGQAGTGSVNKTVLLPTLVPTQDPTKTWVDLFIGSNSNFAFATQSDGTSFSWGDGREGTLATLEIAVEKTPQKMLTAETWGYIAGGTSQVLGISTQGKAFAWGTGALGQLGAGGGGGGSINTTLGPIKVYAPWEDIAGKCTP